MRLPVLNSIFHDDITDEDRAHPLVQLELRRRQRATMTFAIMCNLPTAMLMAAVLWYHTSQLGLAIFIALNAISTAQHWITHLRHPVETDWMTDLTSAMFVGGASWAALPVLAMPPDQEWQTFVASLLVGVLAANVIFGAQFLKPSMAFNIGLAPLAIISYIRLDTHIASATAMLLTVATLFSIALAAINRARDVAASVFGVRSVTLAEGLATEREQLARQVRTDHLTGIPNRAELMHRLENALQPGEQAPERQVGLAYLDIDGFKRVNDALGHRAGDLLLSAVSQRLSNALLEGETVARLSGDELTVLLPALPPQASGDRIGRRLLEVFSEPFELDGFLTDVRASVGVAFAGRGTSPDQLLQRADTALYRAKARGGGQVGVFDAALRSETNQTKALQSSFEEAFWNGKIVPYLQPFVDLTTGRIVGAEALIRWVADDTVRSAAAFMPIVQRLNMGAILDESVLNQVTDFNLALEAEFGEYLPITINVSPTHLDLFLDRVDERLLSQVSIEITEETTLPSLQDISKATARIHDMGSRVILDDFGVGYSSLERLNAASVDGLKIDRQFIAALDEAATNTAIVASMVELAKRLDLQLIAEGIETEQQAETLRSLGVRTGQGFLYSPAVPIDEFMQMLRNDVRFVNPIGGAVIDATSTALA